VYERGLKPCRDRGEGFAAGADLEPRQPGLVEARPLRIAIVSEVRFRREILAEFLERDASVFVVGLCADLAEVVALSPPLQADVVLVDAELRDGVAAARWTLQIKPDIRLIAYAVRETKDDVIAWAEAGVIGYVPDTTASADLVRLILDIHGGQQPCSGRVAAELLRRIAITEKLGIGRNAPSPALALTRRERETAELIATGLSDKEIARRLNISLATAKLHVHNLLGKLNVQRRGQVIVRMHEHLQHPGRVRLDPTALSSR
jgi:two-component system, NarL family, nitrate/nitrite response regulator NarL